MFRDISSRTKILIAAFCVILIPALILAVLGFVTLRRWEETARQVMLESYAKTADMAVAKIEEALRRSEEEVFSRVRAVLRGAARHDVLRAGLGRVEAQDPLGGALYVLDADGTVVYVTAVRRIPPSADTRLLDRLRREALAANGGQGKIHRLLLEDEGAGRSLAFARLAGTGTLTFLVGLWVDGATVTDRFWAGAANGAEDAAMSFVAVLDHQGKAVYSPYPLRDGRPIVAASFHTAFPQWRVAVYPRGPVTFEEMLHRQVLVMGGLIGMLVVAIAGGLLFIYRISRRELEMARLKADFVTYVSHDLKTPLSLIRMYAETLEMGRVADDAKRQEYYRIITQESERLSHLIENFLDFSRIQEGKRPFHFRMCEAGPLVDQTLEAFRYQLERLGFKLEVEIQPDMAEVHLDPDAFRQALANVVDNAIKYSRDRKLIRVEAKVWGGELRVSVEDQGIGIPSEELPRIFERFYRVSRSEGPSSRGSGLGLTLARHLVEAHGGRVAVESTPNEGSTVTLILPLAPEREGAA